MFQGKFPDSKCKLAEVFGGQIQPLTAIAKAVAEGDCVGIDYPDSNFESEISKDYCAVGAQKVSLYYAS